MGANRSSELYPRGHHLTFEQLFSAARRLHGYLLKQHCIGDALCGPDVGIRFNARLGRFVKSYLRFMPWPDRLTYMQAQTYWILDNWLLFDLLQDEQYRDMALCCTEYVVSSQQPAGYWDYPNPEWKGRIATVEGCFAALAMLESYVRAGNDRHLNGAMRWHEYLVQHVRFQESDGMLAINYFANVRGGLVPNNTTLAMWTVARLAQVTGSKPFLDTCPGMIEFLKQAQLPSGELPYALKGFNDNGRLHFLCYQYNAFEFMDLVHYYRITSDDTILPVMECLAGYLSHGLTGRGAASYDCFHRTPEVTYYTAALGAALNQATQLGMGKLQDHSDKAYARVLSQQREDGGFRFYSNANYGFLADRRSYPRSLSMILHHLLLRIQADKPVPQSSDRGQFPGWCGSRPRNG